MVRTTPLLIPLITLLVGGCKPPEDVSGEHALGFDGPPSSCASVVMPEGALPQALTVEAWVQADTDISYTVHPLIVWSGAFALWEDADGTGGFTTEDADGQGTTGPSHWMDGDLHLVTATWDAQTTTSTLFIDGRRLAFSTSVTLGESTNDLMWIGCWGDKAQHDGIIDEVRVSDSVRYTEDFDLPDGPFEADSSTLHLWHFDEGEGAFGLDEQRGADVELTDIEWVEFTLADEI